MIDLKLNEESSITLEMELFGDVNAGALPELRFSILDNKNRFSIIAERIDNGVYKVNFPKFENIFESKIYEAEVELIIDGKHFTPIKEKIKFKKELKADIKIKESVIEVKPSVSVSIVTETKLETPIDPVFTVKKLNKIVKLDN